MNFEPAPVSGMPSYLHLLRGRNRGSQSATPRWWLAPNYEPISRDAEGLAWELRGPGVQCLTEADHFDAEGKRARSKKAGGPAQRWANTLTDRYEELANHDSSFGMLRNAMDLAVVAALVEKEQLLTLASVQLPQLLAEAPLVAYPAPTQVDSQVTFVERAGNWTVSVSGGVQFLPWQIADQVEQNDDLSQVRQQFESTTGRWYW